MATKTVFTDENYQMEVFINQYNKITFTTEYKLDENDYSVLSLENNDIEKLLIILKQLLKDNQNG